MHRHWFHFLGILGGTMMCATQALADNQAENNQKSNAGRQAAPTEEIVVTATKEGMVNVQRIPYAITVFNADRIANTGADNIEDLEAQTPGLNISRNAQAARVYIRGIGTNLDFVGADPSVTIHVDGVYQARPTTALEDFLDVERVEILRGPQGTLYGRNSTGGTINIITRLPDEESRARASVEYGSYNYSSFAASASGALVSDSLYGGLAVMKTDHDPYVDNKSGNRVDGLLDDDSLSAKGTLRVKADAAEAIFRVDYSDIDRATGAYKATGRGTTGDPVAAVGLLDLPAGDHDIAISDIDPVVEQTQIGTSLELVFDLSEKLTLTSLTAWRETDYMTREDTDGTALEVFLTQIDDQQDQLSQELRLNYHSGDYKLVTGLFALQERHDSVSSVAIDLNPIGVARALIRHFDVSNTTTAYAAFANASMAVSDRVNVALGVRYSNEEKEFDDQETIQIGAGSISGFVIDDSETWESWSPKASIDYTTDSGALLYGSVSRGFKSGGYNFTSADSRFDPEYVTAYEAGIKKSWLDLGLRSNLVFFYYDYDDLQVSDFTEVGAPTVSNAAEANIRGFEIENRWTPTLDWLLEFNFAFLSAEYEEFMAPLNATTRVDVSGNALNAAPRRKLNLAAQYFQDISQGTLSYRLEYNWQTTQYFTAFNEEISSQPTYGLLNARLSWVSRDEQWEAQLYGENLTDKAYATSTREFPAPFVGVTRDINPPRTFGAKLVYHIL